MDPPSKAAVEPAAAVGDGKGHQTGDETGVGEASSAGAPTVYSKDDFVQVKVNTQWWNAQVLQQ